MLVFLYCQVINENQDMTIDFSYGGQLDTVADPRDNLSATDTVQDIILPKFDSTVNIKQEVLFEDTHTQDTFSPTNPIQDLTFSKLLDGKFNLLSVADIKQEAAFEDTKVLSNEDILLEDQYSNIKRENGNLKVDPDILLNKSPLSPDQDNTFPFHNKSGYTGIVDPMSHLANSDFDITSYVNEPERRSCPGPGGKKLDLKNQRYICNDDHIQYDEDMKSEDDEDVHVDVETISENTLPAFKESLSSSFTKLQPASVSLHSHNSRVQTKQQETKRNKTNLHHNNNESRKIKNLSNQNKSSNCKIDVHDKNYKIGKYSLAINKNNKNDLKDIGSSNLQGIKNFKKFKPVQNTKSLKIEIPTSSVAKDRSTKKEKLLTSAKNKVSQSNRSNFKIKKEVPNAEVHYNKYKIKTGHDKNPIAPQVTKQEFESSNTVIQACDLNSLLEQFEATENNVFNMKQEQGTKMMDIKKSTVFKTKQAAIKEAAKQLKSCSPKPDHNIQIHKINSKTAASYIPFTNISPIKLSNHVIDLDHDYCLVKNQTKDHLNVTRPTENKEPSILCNQPTVKTPDGKIMVSLLKVNTIRKKLNLEEYKLRRKNCRPKVVTLCDDENARRLQKMNIHQCPPNFVSKTFVSIGVNTEQSWGCVEELVKGRKIVFNPNSLITALVQHLPQVEETQQVQHGEDKTIVYYDKSSPAVMKSNKYVQTITCRSRFYSSSSSSSPSSSSSSRSSGFESRSPSPSYKRRRRLNSEQVRDVEERRVVYVGGIEDVMTREELKRRFDRFGEIKGVSVHFRRTADNYGFVTYKKREDAYNAVEHGNDDFTLPQYDLSFGGRRIFCQTSYSDLDKMIDDEMYPVLDVQNNDSFDELLREAQAKLCNKLSH